MWTEQLGREGIRTMVKTLGPGFGGLGTNVPLEHGLYVLAPDLERARRVIAEPGGHRAQPRRPHPPGHRPRRQPATRRPIGSAPVDSGDR